jgi:phosphocarrier protein HPr
MGSFQDCAADVMSESTEALESSLVRKLRVKNLHGLHARPAVAIVRLLRDCRSTVTFAYGRHTVDAHSVLGLLMLAAPRNAWITVCVTGSDATETLEKLEKSFTQKFGELSD